MNRALYKHGMTIVGLPERLVWYRVSARGLSSSGLRQQRMIARYLEYRNRSWIEGEDPSSLSAFLSQPATFRQRVRWARHDLGAPWCREAGVSIGDGRPSGALWRVPFAAALHPRYVGFKMWSHRPRGDSKSMSFPADDWLPLLRRLTEVSESWAVWKNVDRALVGQGDVDSIAIAR
jgi:hypothetical protein